MVLLRKYMELSSYATVSLHPQNTSLFLLSVIHWCTFINLCVSSLYTEQIHIMGAAMAQVKKSTWFAYIKFVNGYNRLIHRLLQIKPYSQLSTNRIMESNPEWVTKFKDDTFKTKCCAVKSTTVNGLFLLIKFKFQFLPFTHINQAQAYPNPTSVSLIDLIGVKN